MTSRLLYYNPNLIAASGNHGLADVELFSRLFAVIDRTVSLVDRTHTIRLPIAVHSLFPLPEPRPFTSTFEELCDLRAAELLRRADELGATLFVFWSGGIDSTLALVSLLKHATSAQAANMVILLSQESINEYPKFYREHILGKLRVDSAVMFPSLLGGHHLVVNGEHNDQLFGSDMVGKLIVRFGEPVMHQPYSRDTFFLFFDEHVHDRETTNFYLDEFERLAAAAPVSIATNFQFLWWINFSMKWQSVFIRTLSYVPPRRAARITRDYIETNYAPFYCTEDFQRWSLANLDSKIKATWRTYKWPCKDIIYRFTKDADYRDNKIKRGSLYNLLLQQPSYNFIDEAMNFRREIDIRDYYQPDNSFAPAERIAVGKRPTALPLREELAVAQ